MSEKNRTIEDINTEIAQYQREMEVLLEKRETYQYNLTSIKSKLADGFLPQHLYKKYMEARAEYKKDLNVILQDYRVVKNSKNILIEERRKLERELDNTKVFEIKEKIEVLKSKYFDFYKDKTRIAYMRKMANEFIIELDKLTREI